MPFLDFDGLRRFKEKLDAKFGNPIEALLSWKPSSNGSAGQFLRSNGDGTTSWQGVATEQEIASAVDDWMDENIAPNTAITLDSSLTETNAAAQAAAAGNMVIVADAQPSAETNKVWIRKTPDDEVTIPTMSDLNTAIGGIHSIPPGGTTGQVLKKSSGTNYAVEWGDAGSGNASIDDTAGHGDTNVVWSAGKTYDTTSSLREAIENVQKDTTEGDADLDITDENGNVIVRMIGGGVESKNFRGFKYITFSKSGTTSNQSIIITINRNFKKGDRIVLHCDRGVYPYNAPWNQGLAVTYYEDNRVIVENERVDISYLEHIITADTSSVSVEYDGTLSSGSQTVTFSVSLMGDIPVTPTVLTVKKDGTGNYDNLRDAVDAIGMLANDVLNPYVIKVYPGTYDVLSDYTDEEINTSVSSYSDVTFVGLKLLNGVSLVGVGDPNDIVLTASLDTTNYTADVRGGISTLNKQGSGSIENVTIISNNLRYCFHDDFGSQSGKRIKRTIKNCIFRAYNSAYTPNTSYGAGMPVGGMDAEYIDCDFGENGGLHFNTQMLHAVSVRLLNCKGLGFRIGDNTTTTGYTEISEFKFDNCDFKWIGCVVADSTPHVCIRGTGNAPMMIKAPDGVLYDIDNVVVVPLERLNANVGDVVEWYAQNAHGPRYKAATSLDTASGIVVYKDSTDVYIQTSGYVKTSRAGISTFNLNDYVGLSSGSAVVVQNESDSFGRIKYVDDDGAGYIELRWR